MELDSITSQNWIRLPLRLPDGSMVEDIIIFGVDMSSSVHIDNKKKVILILYVLFFFICLFLIIDDSVITCDEIIDVEAKPKTVPKNILSEIKSFYISRDFLLVTISLLISVTTYCYLIKYKRKQKHFLLFYVTNNELKEILC